jgi:hypothetical protein
MFTEIITVYSEITAEYINKLCEKNSENYDIIANDTNRLMYGLNLDNIFCSLQIVSVRTKA